jgi:ankyrin repeat protein
LSSSQRRRRAIHDAAAEGSISRLSACVKDGENINEEDKNRATPFHYAAGAGHVDAMRWILEHGGEIDRRDRGITFCHQYNVGTII